MTEDDAPDQTPRADAAENGGIVDEDLISARFDADAAEPGTEDKDAPLDAGAADNEILNNAREDDDLVARSNDLLPDPSTGAAAELPASTDESAPPATGATEGEDLPAPEASPSGEQVPGDEVLALDSNELDALAESMETGAEGVPAADESSAPAPAAENDTLSESEIAEMVGIDSEVAAAAPEDGGGLNQEDLDQLIAEAQAAGAVTETPTALAGSDETDGALDGLLAGDSDEAPLDNKEPDSPLVQNGGVSLDQDNVAALLGDPAPAPAPPPAPEPADAPPAAPEEEGVSDDLIDALVSAASGPGAAAEVGSENLAAAASEAPAAATKAEAEPDRLISQDDLDALIEAAKVQDATKAQDAPKKGGDSLTDTIGKAVPAAAVMRALRPKSKASSGRRMTLALRAAVALAAGLAVGAGTFMALHLNRQADPTVQQLLAGTATELQLALRIAERHIGEGSYGLALAELAGPMERAPAGTERVAGEFMQAQAKVGAYLDTPDPRLLDELHTDLNKLIENYPEDPRHPDALYWKAQLYRSDQLPIAAQDLYDEILDHFPGQPREDDLLYEAAKLAMQLEQPTKAANRIQQLINEYPGSPHATEARLLLGDAYALAGLPEDARTLYIRSMNRAPSAGDRAQAVLRIGRLEFEQERYPQAIAELDTYLSTTTTTEGSDAVYLLLAQAYRANGELDAARDTLNALLNFFDESEVSPRAYVELSQVLDALGERDNAVRMAKEAVVRYPENPAVLRNAGILHGLNGNPFAAAAALSAADEFGAEDPRLLLTAARHLRTVGLNDEARATYQTLQSKYTGLPEAIIAAAEEAALRFEAGEVEAALEQIDALVVASAGSPEHLTALRTQADFYETLQLRDKLAGAARAIAQAAQDDQDLARAAGALLSAGELEEAQGIIARTNLAQLRDTEAHALLMQLGNTYLDIDPRRAIDTLEEAYRSFPAARTPATDISLLKAYTAANRAAAARRMVFEIAATVQESTVDTPYLIDAAIIYGDYLYGRQDYRAAADAYAQAMDASAQGTGRPVSGRERDPDWAKFQRANALLELSDYEGSLNLYTEISASEAPWAQDAAAKAEYARLEQRLRGVVPAGQQS